MATEIVHFFPAADFAMRTKAARAETCLAAESRIRRSRTWRVGFFLVAPDVRYLGYGQLNEHKEAIARFGSGLEGVVAISASLSS
jgi:hypothetical protein